jgi:hypothetical protein
MKKLVILLALLSISCMHGVKMKGVVLSHAVVADRYGNSHYTSIVRMEDGAIEELNGLQCYVIPVGETIITTVMRTDKE